ncbi:Ankyrin repeat and sterile alpha motif domain-containing protein 1B [Durusdinium trenchii]|uniref:Ankyrin repeat and sterile alpha motif domain-containing protein 1B n=1 Tax=Durusdinium trenchii TaxID=1381693 RepID=A0ABP0IVP5_9DINO
MNENGAELPDLSGEWAEGEGSFQLRIFQPAEEPAAAPNSSYARLLANGHVLEVCKLEPIFSYETRERLRTTIRCARSAHGWRGTQERQGIVLNASHVAWSDGCWMKNGPGETLGRFTTPRIHKVHVVFMNHYDVGYTDFLNGVDNTYMHKYFPLAAATAEKMRASGQNFTYTTHPWLMQRFLACPCPAQSCLARTLNNTMEPPLTCPSTVEVENFSAAAKAGGIAWNAAPFNIQPENMSPELFRAGFDLTRRMDQRFGHQTRTMSIRDVIYVTRAVLPHLAEYNITGLTIGSNGADFPPQVPKLHRWVDEATRKDILVAYHPYGYGGYGLKDCAEAPNGIALCTEFRTDNTGPPAGVSEVTGILDSVRKEYPGATVLASTFDAFFEDVQPVRQQLPVISLEVGDTWVYGNPSDPLKMAQYRAIQRAWVKCMQHEPRCQASDPAIQNMTFFLLKAPEHTWGTPGISGWGSGGDYNTTRFRKDINNQSFMKAAESWAEQRLFNELAVRSLEESSHPLGPLAREELTMLEEVQEPSLEQLLEVSGDALITFSSGTQMQLGADGSIVLLRFPGAEDLASTSAPMASFSYQTFNDSEWQPFTYAYLNDHQMQRGFCKPGSNNFTESAIWKPQLEKLFVSGSSSAASFILAQMHLPDKPQKAYGAPSKIYLKITATSSAADLTFTTIGKQPTMIGESSSVSFVPAAQLPLHGSAWRLMKLGQEIDPEGVLDGGNQFTHGVWGGASVRTSHGVLKLDSLDAINMNPITPDFPVGNPLPASYQESVARAGKGLSRLAPGSIKGMAVNLHNNLWNTNYALFYPYYDARFCESPLNCKNSNAIFRFHLEYEPNEIHI